MGLVDLELGMGVHSLSEERMQMVRIFELTVTSEFALVLIESIINVYIKHFIRPKLLSF